MTGGRTPVLALHGFTGGGADFAPLAARLDRAVVAPDLLGHGAARAPVAAAPYGLDRQVGRLLALADRAGLRRFVLLGYSLGARVALHLALRARARVEAVVLIGGTAGLVDEDERARRRSEDAALAASIGAGGLAAFLEAWRRRPLIATQDRAPPALRAAMRRRRRRLAPHGLARTLEALSPGIVPPVWDALPALDLPALLVTGEDDPTYGELAARMARVLPRATRVVIPGAGHAPHLERPGACARAARRWLAAGYSSASSVRTNRSGS